MGLISIEHSKRVYWADFVFYGAIVLLLAGLLLQDSPAERAGPLLAWSLLGLFAWTLIEYGIHRFVFHALQPFRRWHAEHHQRPMALIGSPTLLSAGLAAGLVFVPALLMLGRGPACALMLGLLVGYLFYALTHHAIHHWRIDNAWLRRRKQWHALHHHYPDQPARFGVTTSLWDHLLGSGGRAEPVGGD